MYDPTKTLDDNLKRVSQLAYLLAYSTVAAQGNDDINVASQLEEAVRNLSHDPQNVRKGSIRMTGQEVTELWSSVPAFLTDLLIVSLDSFLHARLAAARNRKPSERSLSFEEDLGVLWPKAKRVDLEWAFKDTILLAEVRNAVVHGDGSVNADRDRLIQAGWTCEQLDAETCLHGRSFGDFLRFKRTVRTVANVITTNAPL